MVAHQNRFKFSSAVVGALLSCAVLAQTQIAHVDLPAQSLADAVTQLAKATNTNVSFDNNVRAFMETRQAAALKAEMTVDQAFAELLAGSGLRHRFLNTHTVVLSTASAPVGTTEQPTSRAARDESIELAQAQPAEQTRGQTSQERAGKAESQPTSAADKVQEVVVTAQKREERLQDVPISISVLSGEELDRSTAHGVTDALRGVPGVAPNVAVFGGSTNISIRGAAAGGPLFFGSSPVAYYVDSVPFGMVKSAILPDTSAYDLQRVEVLRGPQGTLYGANAQNGVVRVLTKDVNLSAFELKTRGSISSTQYGGKNSRIDTAVNVPLVHDKLAARAVVGYESLSGWIDRPNRPDANDARLLNARLKIGAQPTERLSITASTWFSRSDYGAPNYSPDNRSIAFTTEEPIENDFDAHGLKIAYDFLNFTLTSATSYVDYSNEFMFYINPVNRLSTLNTSKIFTQDIYFASSGQGSWRWTAGGSYRVGEDRLYQALNVVTVVSNGRDKSESFAAFGELTRALAGGRFELTAGLRYFQDDVSATEPGYARSSQFDKLSPRAVATWHATEAATFYASYSEGFRSGFNQSATVARVAPNFPPLEADNLKNYELGAKGGFWDGRVAIDTAVYFIDWQDVQQVLTVPLNPALNLNGAASINGVSASGLGVDFGLTIQPVTGLTLSANFSWNDLTEDEPVIAYPAAAPLAVTLFRAGERLNLSPETTMGASAEYAFPVGAAGYVARVSASANYVSDQFYRRLVGVGVDTTQGESLTIGRAALSLDSPDRWSATLYADNINNEQSPVFKNWTNVLERDLRVRPRTIGLQFEYRL